MPKKKTGARKKAEKQRKIQTKIRESGREMTEYPCNSWMQCDSCNVKQKNRAFCYFCYSIQKTMMCGHCGKTKCMSKSGDCLVKHGAKFTTGLEMVGAICDFCEAWICHGKKCLQVHACDCPLRDSVCHECKRDVWSHGGRVFKCSFCEDFLCEDDQFEHQASCCQLDAEDYKCTSCNKLGQLGCMKCKVVFCDDHVRRKGFKYAKNEAIPCPKCGSATSEMHNRTVSVRKHEFGRQTIENYDGERYQPIFGYAYAEANTSYWYGDEAEDDDDEDYSEDGDSEEDDVEEDANDDDEKLSEEMDKMKV